MTKKTLLHLILYIASAISAAAQEQEPADSLPQGLPWPLCIQQQLDSLCQLPLLETTQLGMMVYDLTADSALYRHGERQLLRPASTMKLLTAITALDLLDNEHQLRTSLYYTGQLDSNVVVGHLVCQGTMDPCFNDNDLDAFIDGLHYLGIDTVRGTIIADRSFKDDDLFGEGWCWDDDNPVLSPLLLNRKDQLVPQLMNRLRREGIVVEEQTTLPAALSMPKKTTLHLVCNRSHSLQQVLQRMLKESDNLYAEAVFYQIAAAAGNHPARASQARSAVKRLLNRLGFPPEQLRVADGSGLSLYNYVTAEVETMMLRYAWKNEHIFNRLYPALPVASIDGTLKSRLSHHHTASNVHAKTGTLTGISSLAGYCTATNGHELAFSIINQGVLRAADGKAFQDAVCKVLCQPANE